jgi:hypothetical protein
MKVMEVGSFEPRVLFAVLALMQLRVQSLGISFDL